jgi:hypothetical protein
MESWKDEKYPDKQRIDKLQFWAIGVAGVDTTNTSLQ